MSVPGNESDPVTGNGKKARALAAIAGLIAAAFLSADAAKNQKEADKHFAEAARLQKKSDDILAGKSGGCQCGGGKKGKKGKPTDVWEMYGDDRGGFGTEDQLASPNAISY